MAPPMLFLPLGIAGLIWWLAARMRAHNEKVAACAEHEWKYISLYNRARPWEWIRVCQRCPHQEPVRDKEMGERLTREEIEKRKHT